MFTKLSLSILTLVSATLLTGSVSFADCSNVISAWEVANGYSTGSNIAGAFDSNNSGTMQALSGIGAVAGAIAIKNDQKELMLINSALRGLDNVNVEAFRGLVNQILETRFSKSDVGADELFPAIIDASTNNQICSRWYGSMSFKQAASIIAAKLAQTK